MNWLHIVAVVVGSLIIFTALTLAAAIKDLRILIQSGRNGALRIFARGAVRHEVIRLIKHVIMFLAVVGIIPWPLAVIISGLLIGTNSGCDLIDRKYAIRKER